MGYQPLPVGIDNFEHLITRNYYFIDKTWFIKELLEKKGNVNLFTRPRRFGKTLNLSMLQYFFEDMRTEDGQKRNNSALFEGLRIMEAGEDVLSCMGRYPVISLSLKSGKRPTFAGACKQLGWELAMEFQRHRYLLDGEMTDGDRRIFERIMNLEADEETMCGAIRFLSHCLERYFRKKVIILIDEYDVPLENAFTQHFYDEMVGFIRRLSRRIRRHWNRSCRKFCMRRFALLMKVKIIIMALWRDCFRG